MEADEERQSPASRATTVRQRFLASICWRWTSGIFHRAYKRILGLLATCRPTYLDFGSQRVLAISESSPKLGDTEQKETSAEEAKLESPPYPLENMPLTRANILKCLSTAPKVPQLGASCIVVRVRSDVVVKYGAERVRINEANTMRLVHERTKSVALPEVIDAWTAAAPAGHFSPSGDAARIVDITYIVMRYVPGTVLHQKWPLMTVVEREVLVERVADMLKELRTIQMDRPGPVGDPVRCEGLYFTDYNAGPFKTKEDLTYWLNNRLQVCKDFRQAREDSPDFVIDRLVMCHMDTNEQNIIVAEDGSPWLLDWGCAGGYPPCFEYGSMSGMGCCSGEFHRMLKEKIHFEEDGPFLARLDDITFAFTTGALSRRYDMELGDEGD